GPAVQCWVRITHKEFRARETGGRNTFSNVGLGSETHVLFQSSATRTLLLSWPVFPPMNRWAIFRRPLRGRVQPAELFRWGISYWPIAQRDQSPNPLRTATRRRRHRSPNQKTCERIRQPLSCRNNGPKHRCH